MVKQQRDLFGNPIAKSDKAGHRRVVNDMGLVEKVLSVAESEGYVLIGVTEKVYRKVANKNVEPAPAYEAEMVHQLLDAKWLTKGGSHTYQCGGHQGPGKSVLVPGTTKQKAHLWHDLAPLPGTRREHTSANPTTARTPPVL
jgi:hypothetical protein